MVLVLVGPLLAAFVVAPVEALDAWLVWGLTLVPACCVLLAATAFHAYQPLVDAQLPQTAAQWLRSTLDRLNKLGISVAAMEPTESGASSFYHPASRTIVLAENVHDEHTARAYSTAAHELGHALFHDDKPFVSRVLLAARANADRCYFSGVGLLFGTVITGATSLRWLALGLVALAIVLHALVVVDEAIASSIAREFLRDDLGDADQGRIARGDLRGALATYCSLLVAYAVPLVAAPWILDDARAVVPPGAALDGIAATFAHVAAWVVLAGAVAAVHVISPLRKGTWIALPVVLLAICWTPLLTVLLCARPGIPGWAIALAVVPAWRILSTPAVVVVRWFGGKLIHEADLMPLPVHGVHGGIPRVTRGKLLADSEDAGLFARASTFSFGLWAVPLALAWLGWL